MTQRYFFFNLIVFLALSVSVVAREYVPGELIVRMRTPINNQVNAKTLLTKTTQKTSCHIYKIQLSPTADLMQAAAQIKQSSNVMYAVPNMILHKSATPSDPEYAGFQSDYLTLMHLPEAWDITTGNPTVVVGVIDTGIDTNHLDLINSIDSRGRNFVSNSTNVYDTDGHGTFISGIIAAQANNGIGITGIAPRCKILPLKASNDGNFSVSDIISAIEYGIDNGANVFNMSFGGEGTLSDFQPLRDAIDLALAANVVVVVAAGNEDQNIALTNHEIYPANFPEVLTISATTVTGNFDDRYSNFGTRIDLAAPGTEVYSTQQDFNVHHFNTFGTGTSYAAPMVSGIAALILSANPSANVAKLLTANATDKGTVGFDTKYGYGIPNAKLSLEAADTQVPVINHTAANSINVGHPITINATITDDINTPAIPSASIFYRFIPVTGVTPSFTQAPMSKSNTLFTAILPSTTTANSRLNYYFIAKDAIPSHSVTSVTFNATVTDNESPVITTVVINNDFFSTNGTVTFNITDNGSLNLNSLQIQITPAPQTSYGISDPGVSFANNVLTLNPAQMGLTAVPVQLNVQISDTFLNTTSLTRSLTATTVGNSATAFTLTGPTASDPVLTMPNPFNPNRDSQLKICFQVSHDSDITIKVYTLSLASVISISQSVFAGYHEIAWNGRDGSGQVLPNGVYLMTITAKSGAQKLIKQQKIAVAR